MKIRLKTLFLLVGLAVLLAQTYALLTNFWWGFELFTHYSVHIFAGAVAVSIVLIALKMWKWSLPLLIVIAIQISNFAPYYSSHYTIKNGREKMSAKNVTLKILSSNFFVKNSDFETIQKIITEEKPDIVQILEADYTWREQKKMFSADYPYITISQTQGAMGYVFASKFPAEFHPYELAGYPSLETIVNIKGSPLRIFSVHTFPPSRADLAEIRNKQFEELAMRVSDSIAIDEMPTLAIGDFNSSPWSPYFKEMLNTADLRDAALGFGIINTWHAHIPFLKIPIDHALISPGIEILNFHKTREMGSDHFPIVATLSLP